MTYKESYMKCNTLEELMEEVEHDIFVAQNVICNSDRIKVIKESAEEVMNLKFKQWGKICWKNY